MREKERERGTIKVPAKYRKHVPKSSKDLDEDSPFKANGYTVVKQWSFEDSKFKRVARPDIYRSSLVSCVCNACAVWLVLFSVSWVYDSTRIGRLTKTNVVLFLMLGRCLSEFSLSSL